MSLFRGLSGLFFRGPDDALVFFGDRSESLVYEPLHALPAIGFAGIDVALGIRGDAVHAVEFAGLPAAFAERGQELQGLTIDNMHAIVLTIGKVDVLLLGILREGDVPRRTGASRSLIEKRFLDEGSIRP